MQQLDNVAGGTINPSHIEVVNKKLVNLESELKLKPQTLSMHYSSYQDENHIAGLLDDERVPGDNRLERAYYLVATERCTLEDEHVAQFYILANEPERKATADKIFGQIANIHNNYSDETFEAELAVYNLNALLNSDNPAERGLVANYIYDHHRSDEGISKKEMILASLYFINK